jgi:hypothetical protein
MARVARRHHDGQGIGHVRNGRTGQHAPIDQALNLLEPCKIGIRLRRPGHVARGDGTAGLDLLLEQAGRKGLPVDPAFELGMLLLEGCNQRCHGEEVIATDVEHELRIGHVAMEIGEVVDLRNRE